LLNGGQKITDEIKDLVKEGMRTGFLKLDATMEELNGSYERERSGTTAICAILAPECIFFANLGTDFATQNARYADQFKLFKAIHVDF
jgi:serine/threonine protein phosphatase PrpC